MARNNPLITHFLNSLDHVCMHPWCSCSDFHSLSNLGLLVTREHMSLKRLDILRTVHTQQKFFPTIQLLFSYKVLHLLIHMSASLNLLPWMQYLNLIMTPQCFIMYIFFISQGLVSLLCLLIYLFCIFFLFYLYKFAYLTHH